MELLIYLLEQKLADLPAEPPAEVPAVRPVFEGLAFGRHSRKRPAAAGRTGRSASRTVCLDHHAQTMAHALRSSGRAGRRAGAGACRTGWQDRIFDEFSTRRGPGAARAAGPEHPDPAWRQALQRSFLSAFVKHQPQYRPEACLVASGSSRTALGILGFHCGISEVVIPDLSWSYEHCFPKVHAVPLTGALELDVDGMIEKVHELCRQDPSWPEPGAVVINNPAQRHRPDLR